MTGLRRTVGFAIALAALSVPTRATRADEVSDTFNQGVDLLQRGHKEDALKAFQKVLALSPNEESAYALWKDTDYAVWRDLLVEGGQFELVAKRLISLARVARKAHQNDAESIKALLKDIVNTDDVIARRKAVRALAAQHGEYAVPYILALLSPDSNEDKRVLAMHALAQMDTDVVIPLTEALNSEDAGMRRNVAIVLGNIGDPRAAATLMWHAQMDADESVKTAAREAAAKTKARGSALELFLRDGEAYHYKRDSVLRDQDYSDVMWTWKGGQLVSSPVPRYLYNDEMAKRCYDNALRIAPESNQALAGLARAYVDENTKIEMMLKAGKDVGEWKARAEESLMAVQAAGPHALDTALQSSVKARDSSTGAALCRVLGGLAKAPSEGLRMALGSGDGPIRSEAAVALGQIAARNGNVADPRVIAILGESAGREIVRLAMIIDADDKRQSEIGGALEKEGVLVQPWNSGAKGVAMVHRAPALDVVMVADTLPDITTEQVLDEIKSDDRISNVPVIIVAKNADDATKLYGDKIAGVITGGDVKPVVAAMSKNLEGDRALADDLAQRSAETLARLAHSTRSDLAPVLPALASTLASRPDGVTVPAMRTLATVGGPAQAAPLLAVLVDEKRSDDARINSAHALAGILARNPGALAPDAQSQLEGVISSKASIGVRNAAAMALGLVQLEPAARAALMHKLQGGESAPAPDKK